MHIFSVRTFTQTAKDVLEGEVPFVWVRGQAFQPAVRQYCAKQGLNE